ncbi:MAG: 50S ribosomal protein P1 [Candidatus Heimdallarchaeaceae archaeon]
MEYIYAGAKVDESRVKALVAALKEVNVEEALKTAAVSTAPVAASATETDKPAAPKEAKAEKKEEEPEEETDLGLSALFG